MRVLVSATLARFPELEDAVPSLVSAGHEVRLAVPDVPDRAALPAAWQGDRRIACVECPSERVDGWQPVMGVLHDLHVHAGHLAQASEQDAAASRYSGSLGAAGQPATQCPACGAPLRHAELEALARSTGDTAVAHLLDVWRCAADAVPSDRAFDAFLETEAPDVIVAAHDDEAWQTELLRSARALAIPCVRLSAGFEDVVTAVGRVPVATRSGIERWWRSARGRVVPAGVIAGGLALLVAFALRELLAPGFDRLPGRDAGNLYSWELFTRSVLASGQLPHWNPYQFGGTPFLADTQTNVLYPPALLLRWLPPLAFLPWMAALHIWLGGIGTVFLARVAGLSWLAAAVAGVAATLGGSIAPWLSNGHLLLIYCSAWLPWALGLAVLSARRPTWGPHPGLVAVLVLQVLAGYLQGSIYLTAAVCLYFVFAAVWPERRSNSGASSVARWRPLAQLACAGALALGLTAFQLLPTARLVSEAGRTAGMSFDDATRGEWRVADLSTFFMPLQEAVPEEAPRLSSDHTAYVGWLLICLLPFAFLDRPMRRTAVFLTVLAGLAVCFAFGGRLPFYQLHYALFPGLRIPGRVLFVATPALAVLGAIGFQRLLQLAPAAARWRDSVAVTITATAGVALATTAVASVPIFNASPVRGRWFPLLMLAAAAIVVWCAMRSRPRLAGVAALAMVGIDLVPLTSGAILTTPVTAAADVRRWIGPPDMGRTLSLCENIVGPHQLLLNRQPTFDGVGGVSLRGTGDWTALATIEGSLPVRRDLLDVSNVTQVVACEPVDAAGLTLVSDVDEVRVYRNETAWPRVTWTCAAEELSRPQALDLLRVGRYDETRYLVRGYLVNVRWAAGLPEADRHQLESRYRLLDPEYREGATWRYRVHNLPDEEIRALLREPAVEDTHGLDRETGTLVERVVDVPEDAERELVIGTSRCGEQSSVDVATADQPDGHVAVNVAGAAAGVLFFSEPFYPERQAFVDGVPARAVRANIAFTAVPVPAGRHHVELRYVPSSFRTGLAITGLTLVAWLGLLFSGRRPLRRS